MKEFIKEKIAFTVALLVALFTISPLVTKFGALGFSLLSYRLTAQHVYYLSLLLLSLAVYCFSWHFLTEKGFRVLQTVGNTMYGLAIVIPPAYTLLYLFSQLLDVLDLSMISRVGIPIASAVVGFAVAKLTGKVKRRLRAVDDKREAKVASVQEFEALSRANQLLNDGYQDLAILEMFKAIEAALNKTLLEAGQATEPFQFQDNLRKASCLELIREQDLPVIERLRNIRNRVAHG